jgi:hypothetical protein
VVLHPPGEEAAAVLVARYLIPIPAVVEDPRASGITLVLGEEHEQVTFLAAHPLDKVLDAIDEQGDIDILEVNSAVGSIIETTDTPTSVLPSTTTEDAPTTSSGISGRPPKGESCG